MRIVPSLLAAIVLPLSAASQELIVKQTPSSDNLLTDNCPYGVPVRVEAAAFGETIIVHREGSVLEHSSDLKIPLWVCEHVTIAELTGSAVRRNKYRPDPKLARESRAELADYLRSGYDRGHLAPAGNQKARQRLKDETFFLSNMAPQLSTFNRQVWRELETLTRTWASVRGEAYIITGPIFYDPDEEDPALADGFVEYSVIGDNEVAVPTHFYKIVVADDPFGKSEAISFVLEHRGHSSPYDFSSHIRSIDRIEELTDLDFMPDLSTADENRVESTAAKVW